MIELNNIIQSEIEVADIPSLIDAEFDFLVHKRYFLYTASTCLPSLFLCRGDGHDYVKFEVVMKRGF